MYVMKYLQVYFIEYLHRMNGLVHVHGLTDVAVFMLFFPKADADKKFKHFSMKRYIHNNVELYLENSSQLL